MRTVVVIGIALVSLTGGGGCVSSTPEDLLKEQIAAVQEVATLLEGITDKATAEATLPRVERVAKRVDALNKRWASLKTAPHEKSNARAQYEQEIQTAYDRVSAGLAKARAKAPQQDGTLLKIAGALGLPTPGARQQPRSRLPLR